MGAYEGFVCVEASHHEVAPGQNEIAFKFKDALKTADAVITFKQAIKAIVDNQFMGLLYDNEVFRPLHTGDKLKGFIKQMRPDGKIDLILQKGNSADKVADFSEQLLNYLKEHDGHTDLNDKSDSKLIYETFGVSKKVFKKGIGDLYKKRIIILDDGITLTR